MKQTVEQLILETESKEGKGYIKIYIDKDSPGVIPMEVTVLEKGKERSETVHYSTDGILSLLRNLCTPKPKYDPYEKFGGRFEMESKMIQNNIEIIKLANSIIYQRLGQYKSLPDLTDEELDEIRFVSRSAKKQLNDIASEEGRYIKPSLRYKILRRDNFTCQCCGAKAPDVALQIDHIHPFSKGGKTIESNLRVTCFECNIGKSNHI